MCEKLLYVCVVSAGSRFDRLIIKTVSERMRSVFKECLAFVCVMTPKGRIRKLHIREFKHMSFSPIYALLFFGTFLTLTLLHNAQGHGQYPSVDGRSPQSNKTYTHTQPLQQRAINYPHFDKQKVAMVTQQDIFFIRFALFIFYCIFY